jgi:hypothetical protein
MKFRLLLGLLTSSAITCVATAQGGVGEIVRIPTPIRARCINAKTDEITMTLRRIITQKTSGFLTSDNRAGVTVIATLNSDGNPQSKTPSVNLVGIQAAPKGQVILPLEYPVASLLPLSPDSGKTFTKNMLLELYLDKVRGANTFGTVLDTASGLLGKLPIPSNPYLTAANEVLQWATTTITNESKDTGGQLFASITLQFNDRDETDTTKCAQDDHQTTGAIVVIGPKGAQTGSAPISLGNLEQKYCWRYVSDSTYEVQYAAKLQGGCDALPASVYSEVPNDYIMILISAANISPPPRNQFALPIGPVGPSKRQRDIQEATKLCDSMNLASAYCGVP